MIVDDEPAIREGLSSIIDWGIVASVLSIRQGTDARLWISSRASTGAGHCRYSYARDEWAGGHTKHT